MPEKNKKTSISALIAAGREESTNVQAIRSVAEAPKTSPSSERENSETPLPVSSDGGGEVILKEAPQQEKTRTSKKSKGLDVLLSPRKIGDTEVIKIPRELHQELKILSTLSGASMIQMAANVLENFLAENKKEIAAYKKECMNKMLGEEG